MISRINYFDLFLNPFPSHLLLKSSRCLFFSFFIAALGRSQVLSSSIQSCRDRRRNNYGLGNRVWKYVLWICLAAKEAGILEIRIHLCGLLLVASKISHRRRKGRCLYTFTNLSASSTFGS
uniref:Uncharacterized protein n=1 Tax=Pseudo-nitzschia australis TaxID=44445 RepID=A0A7S4AA29_9STRA